MKLNEIDFTELEKVKKKCIYFSQAETNKVIKGYKELYPLIFITKQEIHSNIYFELEYYREEIDYIILWEDYSFICNNIGRMPAKVTIQGLQEGLNNYSYFTWEGFNNYIKAKESSLQFINLIEIELFLLAGENEKASYYNNYRNEYRRKQVEKDMRKIKEREEKAKQEELEHQEEINKQLLDAEQLIINHKTVYNNEIETSTLFLMLFKKHNIKVPLKTQGWINKALAKIEYNQDKDKYTYFYYNKQSKNSTVFGDYLQELINCINNQVMVA